MKLVRLALAALVILGATAVTPAGATACADPIATNSALVHRSVSGVEVDWYFTLRPGCSATIRLETYRQVRHSADPRVVRTAVFAATFAYEPRQFVVNALIPARLGGEHDVLLIVGGRPYGILAVHPGGVR